MRGSIRFVSMLVFAGLARVGVLQAQLHGKVEVMGEVLRFRSTLMMTLDK